MVHWSFPLKKAFECSEDCWNTSQLSLHTWEHPVQSMHMSHAQTHSQDIILVCEEMAAGRESLQSWTALWCVHSHPSWAWGTANALSLPLAWENFCFWAKVALWITGLVGSSCSSSGRKQLQTYRNWFLTGSAVSGVRLEWDGVQCCSCALCRTDQHA